MNVVLRIRMMIVDVDFYIVLIHQLSKRPNATFLASIHKDESLDLAKIYFFYFGKVENV